MLEMLTRGPLALENVHLLNDSVTVLFLANLLVSKKVYFLVPFLDTMAPLTVECF